MTKALTTRQNTELTTALTADLVDAWLDHERTANEASATTLAAYRTSMSKFVDWLSTKGAAVGTVDAATILAWRESLRAAYSPQTVNLRLSAVRSFYRWAVTTGHLAVSPAAAVKGAKRSKSNRHKRDPLTDAEVMRVLAVCDDGTDAGKRDRAIIGLMVYCGLRTIEVHRADLGHLRTTDDRLVLDLVGKGRTEADELAVIPIPLEPVLHDWLSCRPETADAALFVSLSDRSHGHRLGLPYIREMVKARFRAAGVAGLDRKSAHSLRHTAITKAARKAKAAGRSPLDVQRFARHSSLDTTMIYVHETGRLDNPLEDLIAYNGTDAE